MNKINVNFDILIADHLRGSRIDNEFLISSSTFIFESYHLRRATK